MAPPPRKKLPVQKRRRSVPFPKPFIKAAIFTSLFLLSLIGLITAIVTFFLLQTQQATFLVVVTLFITFFLWIISLFIRRSASCPLCKGTPYFNSGAHTHKRATKLPFINHGISNVICTITAQTFRCMYCGQPYDLLKPVSSPPPAKRKKRGAKTDPEKGARRRRTHQKSSLPDKH